MRRWLLAVSAVVVAGAVVAGVAWRVASSGSDGEAARLFGPLPAGYRYAEMEPDDAAATADQLRRTSGATDVATMLVGTPQDLAPVGVAVAAFVFRAPPDPLRLASLLERDVTLVAPRPKTLAGQPVLGHEGDATFSSVTLWVHGRLALLTYAATTAEVDGVMEALLAGGAWRTHPAAPDQGFTTANHRYRTHPPPAPPPSPATPDAPARPRRRRQP